MVVFPCKKHRPRRFTGEDERWEDENGGDTGKMVKAALSQVPADDRREEIYAEDLK